MLKKFMSAFLALSLMSTAGLVSAGATETKQTDNAEASEFKIIHPIIKNNITTYYDGNGNVVDITE